ncbi:sulfate/molybdate ABC transporter ATP-binding protein [Williamsia serinedens]|uniref:Molybdate transport system ATP-binding protein n=1 Tax=Williamsia serinedens TaxID=391736 RepID=A0ABT1H1Q0_9NOCA|nr:ATP-binding cassette domain-containing protein [Williamsia serinedens]MCP2159683.1 molybdate transport system ATP-binding protein [Williamsia serinedens]
MTGLSVRATMVAPDLDVDVSVPDGTTVAVLGRNGAGKSSLLHVVAGLLRPTSGRVAVGERVLVDASTFVAPHRRSVALLGQQPRLFPHMTVAQNIAFAPAAAHRPRAEVRRRVAEWAEAVDVADLLRRRPHQLSGGQAQRVAVARALAADPDVLLLDEPFAALDVDVAARLRALVGRVLADRGRVALLVTHDLVDAVTLADEALVLTDGRVTAHGPVREVLSRPTDDFAARLAGLNLVSGTWDGEAAVDGDVRVVGTPEDTVRAGAPVVAVFDPSAVAVYTERPGVGSPRTVLAARVVEVAPVGSRVAVRCAVADREITAEVTWGAVAELGLAAGAAVWVTVKAGEVQVHPTAR